MTIDRHRPRDGGVFVDDFPHGWDYAWLAVDADDHVGIFTNAGKGPIPAAVLRDRETADRAEQLVKSLPERGGHEMVVSLPRPDDFIAFARRSLFAYDWRDVHRRSNPLHSYDLTARPISPVTLGELDESVAELARRVRFASVRFGESVCIAVPPDAEG